MRKLLLVLFVVFTLLFVGCETNSNAKQSSFELNTYNGGDVGLEFDFDKNMPPEKIRDNGIVPFTVRVVVENKGEYDIEEGKAHVALSGIDPKDLGLSEVSKPLGTLNGVSKKGDTVIPGGRGQVIFSNLKYLPSVGSGSIPLKLYANICYPYETKSTALVCIKKDTVNAVDENNEICTIDGDKKYANSGAPIKIENVKEFAYGKNSIQIQFDIVHKPLSNNAAVYKRGSLDANCNVDGNSPTSAQALMEKNKVTYKVESGIEGLDCENTGTNTNTVTLSDNRYTVVCVQDTSTQGEYEKPFFITLDYDYLDRKSKTITVEHVDQ